VNHNNWTREWPKEPGVYWICGYISKGSPRLETTIMEVWANNFQIVKGSFYYPSEAGKVVFKEIPALTVHELTEAALILREELTGV